MFAVEGIVAEGVTAERQKARRGLLHALDSLGAAMPGEKLFEELITSGENILPTYHEKIKIFQGPSVSLRMMEGWVKEAEALAARRDPDGLVEHLKRLVPEYQASSSLDGRRSRYAQAIGD